MGFISDIEIAQENTPLEITEISQKLNIDPKYIEQYGRFKAKIDNNMINDPGFKKKAKLILVTAINPTPAGEGKTTVTIGLADGIQRLGKRSVIALREPSLGPVFGVKGGAAGGGYSQIVPMEDINPHFTGDFHAIGSANNLLAAMLDNHIYQGNSLNIDSRRITWHRCVDMNDRQLRFLVDGLGGKTNGVPREDNFDITVASEIMAVLCLASGMKDLKERLARIIVAYNYDSQPVTAGDLKAEGAMAALLKDAIKPNLVQSLEHTPAFVHGGPFANIAHGCNSIIATKMAMGLGEYVVTEAGFGADLGAEKFLDIKCRTAGISPDAVVIVATVKALKYNGGVPKDELADENIAALKSGIPNLLRHINNLKNFGMNVAVAINKFWSDTQEELDCIKTACEAAGANAFVTEVWAKGGEGAHDLAKEVITLCEKNSSINYPYNLVDSIEGKINAVVNKIYGGSGAELSSLAKKQIKDIEKMGLDNLPICMAKTQYSFSDNPKLLGAPSGFKVSVKSIRVSAGAGFLVILTGDIITMPGLPKIPAAEMIDIDENGKITGLF